MAKAKPVKKSAKPKAKPRAAAKPKARAKAKPAAKPRAKAKPAAKPRAKAKPRAAAKPRAKAKPAAKPRAKAKPAAKPRAKAKPAAARKVYAVRFSKAAGWQVKEKSAKSPTASYARKPDAVTRAKALATKAKGQAVVYKLDGKVQDRFDYPAKKK